MNNKITAIVIVVLVVLVGIFIVYNLPSSEVTMPVTNNAPATNQAQNGSAEQAGKKTYRDDVRFTSFDYPAELAMGNSATSGGSVLNYFSTATSKGPFDNILYVVTPKQKDLATFFATVRGNSLKSDPNASVTDITVASLPAKKVTTRSAAIEQTSVYFFRSGTGYTFTANKNISSGLDMRPALDVMLDSFRFTK